MVDRVQRRNPRLRLACARCQRRKIRCDGQYPSCNNCRKASAICADGESARLRGIAPESSVDKLQRRITWLESIVKQRLPDVNLDSEPPIDVAIGVHDGDGCPETTCRIPLDVPMTAVHSNHDLETTPASITSAHEIGMVSVANNSDQRYLGPSSGYFLARMLLGSSAQPSIQPIQRNDKNTDNSFAALINELIQVPQVPPPFPSKEQVLHLSRIYFDVIQPQFPVLHEPSFLQDLEQLYSYDEQRRNSDSYTTFQVYMVFALGSTVVSRRGKYPICGESYCLSALQCLHNLNVENSLRGLQCLVLLLIFTIHSPYMRLNVWYLNYQCIAALIDLGLQRDIRTNSGISFMEQEMRTRMFWIVFTLDRTIATMMGRPIGLRDEACELRLPQNIDDHTLGVTTFQPNGSTGSMEFSIHLFKLARLNSEIKYVANSIIRGAPSYAYPTITNIDEWQHGMLEQLDQWATEIPAGDSRHDYMSLLCELRYHSLRMLLLRPSPAIPQPSTESFIKCRNSACQIIRILEKLYKQDLLVHSWMTFHDLLSSTVTMLYCIRAVPDFARTTEIDVLMNDLGVSLNILSATGEHWAAAKRCRNILNDLGKRTIRWIKDLAKDANNPNSRRTPIPLECDQDAPTLLPSEAPHERSLPTISGVGDDCTPAPGVQISDPFTTDGSLNIDLSTDNWNGSLSDQFGFNNTTDIDSILRNLFDDFIPHNNPYLQSGPYNV